MSRIRMAAPLALLVLAQQLPAQRQEARQPESVKTDVPIKTVMLFSSGVGYFEHAGMVHGNSATELRFKTTQINDILKSLVLHDDNGGKVSSITYASKDPLEKTLRSFQVDITNNPSLANLLNQLRGARITVQTQAERISGNILGVEVRNKSVSGANSVDVPVLNLLGGATIRSVELQSVSSLSLDDAELQDELTKALTAVGQARDKDKKPVTINFIGNGDRHVRIGYVIEAPIWKTSYRLLLGAKSSSIQGWAIVENQTETDWNNVSLSLVSGRPMSFKMDLYQPLYVARPTVTQELFAGLVPQLYDDGIAADSVSTEQSAHARDEADYAGNGVAGGASRSASKAVAAPATIARGAFALSSVANTVESVANASRMGELFQFVIPNVTLARQKSAMLPIVADTIGIERISIYNESVLKTNPLNGVRMKNTTGKHLLQGPVTVLDGDNYAGDARIDNVPPGQQRMLSFGVDLDLVVDNTKNSSQTQLVTARLSKGILTIERKFLSSREYRTENKGDHDKTLVIEHPVRDGWKLAGAQKSVETTPSLYRFQDIVAAHKVTLFVVKEENVQSDFMTVASMETPQLMVLSREGEMPAAVRAALVKVGAMKQAIQELDRLIAANVKQIETITAEQARIRENMKTVGQSNEYYKRLLTKLDEQESSIEKLQKQNDELKAKATAQRNEMITFVNDLVLG